MKLKDVRSLPPQAQQALRFRAAIAVVEQGRSQGEAAKEFGVSRTAINQWVQRYRSHGETALTANQQGRPCHPSLQRSQVATITSLIRDYGRRTVPITICLMDARSGFSAN